MAIQFFQSNEPFQLENGSTLHGLQIAYHTYGTLNQNRSNVVWVCHALTANSDVVSWWPGLVGDGCVINPEEHFIVCANILGSHYGTTGPLHNNTLTGLPHYQFFPQVTIRDLVKAHQLLASYLGIKEISLLIGGSLGGQQAQEWAIDQPERIKNLVLLATNARHSPWGIAFNESQRMAIYADRTYYAGRDNGGAKGLSAARSIALLSYRNYETYGKTQREDSNEGTGSFKAAGYQRYQGKKMVDRFNAYSYIRLTQAMDSHNVGRNRGSIFEALSKITAKALVIGIQSDVLFPVAEQQLLAQYIKNADYEEISSLYGHDGFLLETAQISQLIGQHLNQTKQQEQLLTSDLI